MSDPQTASGAPRVVTLGETMALMHSPGVGSLAHVPTVEVGIGGAESNAAIGLRRLGIETAWISRVGDDELGRRVVREIRAEGVDVLAGVDPQRPTGLMIKSHPVANSTTVRYYRTGSAASVLSPADLPSGLIENAEMLHLSGITPVLSDTARAAVRAALDRARSAGVTVSFDVNFRAGLATREQAAPILAEIAAQADIVFGGPEELALLRAPVPRAGGARGAADPYPTPRASDETADPYPTPRSSGVTADPYPTPRSSDEEEELLRALVERGIPEVVAKRGADGAWALLGQELTVADGVRVEVVDTVGAGDAFVAGYLSAHLEGLDVAERLARANACGAFLCMSPGDWEGAPRREELATLTGSGDPVRR